MLIRDDGRELDRVTDKGATMRLGTWPTVLKEGTRAEQVYGKAEIRERQEFAFEAAVRCVRSARRAGRDCWLRNTVSVSAARRMACFQLSCTGDSAADSIRAAAPVYQLHPPRPT